jgi:hypothetical protein
MGQEQTVAFYSWRVFNYTTSQVGIQIRRMLQGASNIFGTLNALIVFSLRIQQKARINTAPF